MTNSIYRFRSIDKVLSSEDLGNPKNTEGYDELRKQQIYLSSLENLNDPMEGYKEVYWKGDKIAWKNLIKHYLLCLEHVIMRVLIGGDEYNLSAKDIPILKKYSDFPTQQYRENFNLICDQLFSNQTISQYPQILSQRPLIRKNELLHYLNGLHIHAIASINKIYHKNGFLPEDHKPLNLDPHKHLFNENYFNNLSRAEQEHKDHNIAEMASSIAMEIQEEFRLILQYNNRHTAGKNQNFLADFPNIYLKQIEQLLYPDCYIACFSDSYRNSSMWSHYAGNHEGICFQFKTNDQKHFNVLKHKGLKSPYALHPLKYKKNHPELNFFESLGRLPIPHLREVWFTGENNEQSDCAKFLNPANEEKWRQEYWEKYYDFLNTKTTDWTYENEYRLIRYSTIGDNVQLANYDFNDLEGIIFGINTKTEHKIKIMEIIEEKCEKTLRKDFKFYQAAYCRDKGEIKKRELTFLKLS